MMRLCFVRLVLAAAAIVLSPSAHAQVVGVSAAVKNDVRLRKPGTPLPRPVQLKQRIALREQVQTGVKSQLQMLLLDRSVFTVGANARVTIDRFVYDPSRNTRSVGATVAKGAFRFMSGRRNNGGDSSITTPVATIGVRGTIVDLVVGEAAALIAAEETAVGRRVASDPQTASLVVLRGPGRATQGNAAPGSITVTAGGRTVAVDRPMLAVFVPGPGRAPIGPFQISNSGLMQMQALLFPSVAERLGWRQPADNLATVPPGAPPAALYPAPRQPRGGYPPPDFGGAEPHPRDGFPQLPNLQLPPRGPNANPPPRQEPANGAPGSQPAPEAAPQQQPANPKPTPPPRPSTAPPPQSPNHSPNSGKP